MSDFVNINVVYKKGKSDSELIKSHVQSIYSDVKFNVWEFNLEVLIRGLDLQGSIYLIDEIANHTLVEYVCVTYGKYYNKLDSRGRLKAYKEVK